MTFQYRAEWSGSTGGPGVTVLNARLSGAALSTGPQQFADNVRVFFEAVKGYLPNELTIAYPDEVTELDTVSGQLLEVHPVTAPASTAGNATTGYAHASGARVDWLTSSILNGRRLRGTTYLVPISAGAFGNTGLLLPTAKSVLQTAAQAYVDGMQNIGAAAVWSRTHGIVADVIGVSVPDLGAVLRSRRD